MDALNSKLWFFPPIPETWKARPQQYSSHQSWRSFYTLIYCNTFCISRAVLGARKSLKLVAYVRNVERCLKLPIEGSKVGFPVLCSSIRAMFSLDEYLGVSRIAKTLLLIISTNVLFQSILSVYRTCKWVVRRQRIVALSLVVGRP